MEKAIVFLNGKAGNNYGRRNAFRIIDGLYELDYEPTVLPVGGSRRIDLVEYLKANASQYQLCVCVGGDGSMHHTINGVIKSGCSLPIAYIPCGTTNDYAKSLGLNIDLSAAKPLFGRDIEKIDAGLFNKEYFTYVAAFGALTEVSYSTPQEVKNMLGYTAYALNSVQSLPNGLSLRIPVRVESEEFTEEDVYMYGSVSNCYSVAGIRSPILEDVSLNDGLFEVILIKAPNNIGEMMEIIGTLLGGDLHTKSNRHVRMFTTKKVTFTFEEETEWTLDGEYGGHTKKAAVSVKKQCIRLMR